MGDRFQFSNKPNGPWIELRPYTTAQQALEAGKAGFQWSTVFVARMREIDTADVLSPNFVDDLAEDLVLKHGNELAEEIIARIKRNSVVFTHAMWAAVELGLAGDDPIWVADMVHQYGPDQNVRPADFNRELQAQISQKKTREAIERQKAERKKLDEDVDAFLEGNPADDEPIYVTKNLKPKLDDML